MFRAKAERPSIPMLMTVSEVMEASRLGETTVYKLLKAGDLRSVLLCGRRMIFADSYAELLRRLETEERGKGWGNENHTDC